MNESIRNLAVSLFADTFDRLFILPVRSRIADLTRQRRVIRQIDAVSDAAAQGLARFLNWETPDDANRDALFAATRKALESITAADVWPPSGLPESHARSLKERYLPQNWEMRLQAQFGIALELVLAAVWQAGIVFHA